MKKELEWSDCVITFGQHASKNKFAGNVLYDYVNNTNKSVITMIYTNSGYNSGYHLSGKWGKSQFNAVKPRLGHSSFPMGIIKLRVLPGFEELKDELDYSKIRAYKVFHNGKLNKKVANLIAVWTNETTFKVEGVAIAERTDCRLLHLNFRLCELTGPLLFRCVKYIRRRKLLIKLVDHQPGLENACSDLDVTSFSKI